MLFKSIKPHPDLMHLVRKYWIIEDENSQPTQRKIIPDGYPEIIFHHRKPYLIKMHEKWESQHLSLFAGQISKYFYLKNTGASGMVGIKLMPAAASELFAINMTEFTDRVVPLREAFEDRLDNLERDINLAGSPEDKISVIDNFLLALSKTKAVSRENISRQAVNLILKKNGLLKVEEISDELEVNRRKIERSFKKVIGLSPKFYSRIIRFNYIFEIMKEGKNSWIRIALDSGYFDQSHFIKEFKAFTGEEPSGYGFTEKSMANFFLNEK